MILSNVSKLPVIVIAPPRSGSSVICAQIGLELNLPHYNDITYADNYSEIENCFSYIKNNNNYVMKFHAFDMHKYPKWLLNKIKSGETYNIKVERKDFFSHVASTYIAEVRNLYHYDHVNVKSYNDIIELCLPKMWHCILRILKAKKELDKLDVTFDQVVAYEDHQYNDDVCIKTPLPTNYEEIIEFIKGLYKK